MTNAMDSKLKYRIVGVALATLVLMIVVPELIKKPQPQATQTIELQMPERPAVVLPEPENKLAFTDEQLDAGADIAVFNNPNIAADDDFYGPPLAAVGSTPPVTSPTPSAETTPADDTTPATTETDTRPPADTSTLQAPAAEPPAANEPPQPPIADTNATPTTPEPAAESVAPPTQVAVAKPPIELMSLKYRQPANDGSAQPERTTEARDTRWMVQAGAFAVEQNANLLHNRLRAKQFPASLSPAEVDGRRLYLVRLGPYASKNESEQVRRRLLREERLQGAVVPY